MIFRNIFLLVFATLVPGTFPLTVKIGVILPFAGKYHWVLSKTRPAIEYARESVMNDPTLLVGHNITLVIKDSKCSHTYGPLAAIDMYVDKSAHVFLGPSCDYAVAPIARFSSVKWDIPIISAGALVTAFQNKTEFKLLTRMMGAYAKAGEFLLTLFRSFRWKLFGMFYHDYKTDRNIGKSTCYFTLEAIFLVLQNLTYPKEPWYTDFDETDPRTDYEYILRKASQQVRGK